VELGRGTPPPSERRQCHVTSRPLALRDLRWLSHGYPMARWFDCSQTLGSFRMNGAAMVSGGELVARHAAAMGHTYHALVRYRADVGSPNMDGRGSFRNQFLSNVSWHTVRRHALAARSGDTSFSSARASVLSSTWAGTSGSSSAPPSSPSPLRWVHNCHHPMLKRIDFCFWCPPRLAQCTTAHRIPCTLLTDDRYTACAAGRPRPRPSLICYVISLAN
jgi:hypothetical protein